MTPETVQGSSDAEHRRAHRMTTGVGRPLAALAFTLVVAATSGCTAQPEVLDNGTWRIGVYPEPTGGLPIAQTADVVDLGGGCMGAELIDYDESPMILAVPMGSTLSEDGDITVVTPDNLGLPDLTFTVGDRISMQAAHIYRKGEEIPNDVLVPEGCPDVGVWLVLP